MNHFFKKSLSAIIAAAMLVGMIPTSALAAYAPAASDSDLSKQVTLSINPETKNDPKLRSAWDSGVGASQNTDNNNYPYQIPITPSQTETEFYTKATVVMEDAVASQLTGQMRLDLEHTKFVVMMAMDENMTPDTQTDLLFNSTFLMPDEEQMHEFGAVTASVTKDEAYVSEYQSDTAEDMRWKISGWDALKISNQSSGEVTTENGFDWEKFFNDYNYFYGGSFGGNYQVATAARQAWDLYTGSRNSNVNLYIIPVKLNWSELVDDPGNYDTTDPDAGRIYQTFTMEDWQCPMELTSQVPNAPHEGLQITIDLTNVSGNDAAGKLINKNRTKQMLPELNLNSLDAFIPTSQDTHKGKPNRVQMVNYMPVAGMIIGDIYNFADDDDVPDWISASGSPMQTGNIFIQFAYATPGSVKITKTIEGLPADAQMPESLAVTITDQNGNPARDLNGKPVTASIKKSAWKYSDGKWTATITVDNLRPSDETYDWDYRYTVSVADEAGFDGYTLDGTITTENNEDLELKNQYELSRNNDDGTITYDLKDGAEVPEVQVTSEYTQDAPDAFTLTYKANGGVGDDRIDTYPLDDGASSVDAQIKDNMFTREGYTFTGWADASGEKYAVGSTIALSANLILYAQWSRDAVWNGQPVDKTATQLDENYESNVTLSLPAAGYQKEVDVVFAIDCSSVLENNTEEMAQALTKMAQELIQKDNIILNVGVVGFAHNADVLAELQEVNAENVDDFMSKLAKEFADSLTDDSQIDHDGGSNLQVGIRTARRLLDGSETGAMPQNRHLILMTDGAGFYYCRSETDDTSVGTVHNGDRKQCLGNMDGNSDVGGSVRQNDSMYMRAKADGKTFGDFIAEQGAAIEASAENSFSKDQAATAPAEQCYTTEQVRNFEVYPYLNMERGTYFAAQELLKAKDTGYQLVTIGYTYGHADSLPSLGAVSSGFRDWTETIGSYYNGSSNLDTILDSISNELGQFVDAGSTIIDEIGSGTDSQGKPYDFNFINDVNRLKLTVGDTTLNVTQVNDTTYNFGTEADPDQFVLHYYANSTQFQGKSYGECFVLDINVPVTMEQPVTLTYAVDLTNPQTEPGTYEKLNTNNIAILYPVDSDGNPITPVEFPKPVVSYTVEESGGGGAHHPDPDPDPDPDDNDDEEEIIDEEVPLAETPWLNTVDHYAYIVGYPEDYVTGQPTEDESRWPVKPQANISRAEVATIFFRLLTDEARDQFWMTTNNFPDVAPDAWYNNAISTMVNAGIIQGYEDGTFRPNNNITRAEFAAIASRFMSSGYDVEEDLFTDIANHWARENINDAAMTQWIHGYPDGTFLPDQAITRAEAVTLVNNVLQRKPHKDHMLDSMIKWPDNPESAWYYEAIQEATNSHDYDLFEDAEYETWTALQENRDWAALEKDWVNTHRTGGEVA